MKKIGFLFYTLLLVCFSHFTGTAQEKQTAKISLIKQTRNTVTVTITSPSEFYIGGNTHILYVGNKHFDLNQEMNKEGKGMLQFYMPANEFHALKNGRKMYLC